MSAEVQETSVQQQNRWVRPLLFVLGIVVISIIFMFIANFIAQARGASTFDTTKWMPFLLVGAVIAYGLGVAFGDPALWSVETRQVVYAAVGAALYGVFSWATNIFLVPSVSLVTVRPAIVIPVFFGFVYGPSVGFLTGFVGNALGDALTGWGVFPVWDFGNGLIGLIPGLVLAFRNRTRASDIALGLVAVVAILASVWLLVGSDVVSPLSGATVDKWVALTLIGGLLIIAGLRYGLRNRPEIASAQVWGGLAVFLGIGFASMADIWWNGYNFTTAFVGEFVPAAGTDLLNVAILLPILLTAWNAAQARTGR
ncbi:MAG TPA: ECF transporter S component [Ktedonobacterales bacterium]|jgi:uncharacterized membrane protein